jgi:hypothetical protein
MHALSFNPLLSLFSCKVSKQAALLHIEKTWCAWIFNWATQLVVKGIGTRDNHDQQFLLFFCDLLFTGCSLQQCRKMLKIGAIGATAFLLTQDFWIAISDLSPVHHLFSLYDLLLSTFKAQNLSYKKRWQIVLVTVCMCILHKNNLQWLLIQQDPALGAYHFGVRRMTKVYFLIFAHYKEEVITSGQSLAKCQTFTFIMNSCDKAIRMTDWLHQLLTVVVDKHIIICQKFQANHYYIHNLCPKFLSHFWNQWKDSAMMLASTQET